MSSLAKFHRLTDRRTTERVQVRDANESSISTNQSRDVYSLLASGLPALDRIRTDQSAAHSLARSPLICVRSLKEGGARSLVWARARA